MSTSSLLATVFAFTIAPHSRFWCEEAVAEDNVGAPALVLGYDAPAKTFDALEDARQKLIAAGLTVVHRRGDNYLFVVI